MSYVRLANSKIRGPDGVAFPWDDRDPRFPAFLAWLQAGGTLLAAAAPQSGIVPQSIDMRQYRRALLDAGLYDAVVAFILSSDDQGLKIDWEFGTVVDRTSALVAAISASRGLDDAATDALFVAGAGL